VVLGVACSRPPTTDAAQPRGVQLENVQLTTWRKADLSASGTAKRATLTVWGFSAADVEVTTATGSTLRAAAVEGDIELTAVNAASGAEVKTSDGCVASTRTRVDYAEGVVRSAGAVNAHGCGFELDGQRASYIVAERRADIEGPVRTRIDAQ
jgi:hypothetical protein